METQCAALIESPLGLSEEKWFPKEKVTSVFRKVGHGCWMTNPSLHKACFKGFLVFCLSSNPFVTLSLHLLMDMREVSFNQIFPQLDYELLEMKNVFIQFVSVNIHFVQRILLCIRDAKIKFGR